jgi:RNA polymerase sigma factor (sigma-70 family)
MSELPSTSETLIARVRQPDAGTAWAEFGALYGPLVYRTARHGGLQDADAEDVRQDVLRAVAGAIGRFEHAPGTGSFRRWLFTLVRNRLADFYRSARHRDRGRGGTDGVRQLAEVPAPVSEADWDAEFERHLFGVAAERVRAEFQPHTWQAFWRTAVDGGPAPAVADELGMSVGAVHVARSRVLARLRKEVAALTGDD